MKKLIYEDLATIEVRRQYAGELITALNTVLNRFKSTHNHFGQPVDESFAFQLVSQPNETFDELLRLNSPVKPIAGKTLDVRKLADLVGIDYQSFIADCTVVMPGSRDRFNRKGVYGFFSLKEKDRPLVSWKDDQFVLNDQAVNAECEAFRVYAESPEQFKELAFWEDLCDSLNTCRTRELIDVIDANLIADRLTLKFRNGKFAVDQKRLAALIKSMLNYKKLNQ